MVTSASPGAPRRRLPLERLVVTSQVHGVSGCGNKRSRQSRACSEIILLIDSFPLRGALTDELRAEAREVLVFQPKRESKTLTAYLKSHDMKDMYSTW